MIDETRLLNELGRRIRMRRQEAGLTAADLARRSGVSRRYVTEAESGRANLSIVKLARLAVVLRVTLAELCDLPLPSPRNERIALVGLRGAGKTAVGRILASRLEVPFVELDGLVEEVAGMTLAEIFSLHGAAYYRDLEREALERCLTRSGTCVVATGGSIVTHAEAWERLLQTCHCVWLRADPDDHWTRVIRQGDERPIQARPRARDELRAILAEREPLYRRAHAVIDTSMVRPDEVADQVLDRRQSFA